MSPFEPLSPNFNTLYCEAIDWLKMSTPNMHWFQLFRRGQKCNLWIPLSRTYTMRFWGRLFALKMVVLIHKVGMNIFKHVTDCFNSELKGKFQALISIDFLISKRAKHSYLSSSQQKMKYLLPLSCFRLRQDFHKDQTFFCWSQSSLTFSRQNNLFLVLSMQVFRA